MDIEDIRIYQSPNVFSLKHPVVKLKVRLGKLAAKTIGLDIAGIMEVSRYC